MHHYFEAITNTSGDSLIGYFARVIDPATQDTVTLSADNNGTPIVTVSGIENMAKTDDYGNLDFYVEPGTYHLDIYAPNATSFIMRVPNVAMNSTKGDTGDTGPQGATGPADAFRVNLAALKAAAISDGKSDFDGSTWFWTAGNYSATPAAQLDVNIVAANSTPLTTGAWVRQTATGVTQDTGAPPLYNIIQSAQQKFEGDKDVMDWLSAYERSRARDRLSISDVAPMMTDYFAYMDTKQKFGILKQTGGRLPFSTGVTVNAQRVQLRLAGIWAFGGVAAGTNCVTITSPSNEGRDGRGEKRPLIQGLNIDGNGYAGGSVGIRLQDCDNIILDQWFVRDIDTGVVCGENVYCNRLSGGAITVAKQGVIVNPSSNTGERIMINDTTFASCTTGVVVNSAIADVFMHQCSVDYPRDWTGDLSGTSARFVSALAGRLSLNQCHLEGNGPFDAMGAISAMYVSPDSSARLRVSQTEMLMSTTFANYAIENLNSFDVCRPEFISMQKVAGANGFLYAGRVVPQSSGLVNEVTTNGPFFSAAQNLMMDGTFATTLRDASVTEGANQTTALSADSIVLTRNDDTRNAGEKSINAQIIGGVGTPRRWCLRLPIPKGEGVVPGSRIWIKNVNAGGTLFLNQYFVAGSDGSDGRFQRSGRQDGSGFMETIDLGALPTSWTAKVMGGYSYRAPPWATHIEIDFDLVNATAGNFRVTDCYMGYSK